MTLKIETMYDIGETVYLLNLNREIIKGVVTKVNSRVVAYKDCYTGEINYYPKTEYSVHTDYPDDLFRDEDELFAKPDDIIDDFNRQIQELNQSN